MIYKEEEIDKIVNQLIEEGRHPLVINKLSDINENYIDFDRLMFRKDLTPMKTSHVANLRILFSALNQSYGELGNKIKKTLQKKYSFLTDAFIESPRNWISNDPIHDVFNEIKKAKKDFNPRMLNGFIKRNIIDKSFFDGQDMALLFAPVKLIYEVADAINRSSCEDYCIKHIQTNSIHSYNNIKRYESIYIGKFYDNYLIDNSVNYTNQIFGKGLLEGLTARKHMYFADAEYLASEVSLEQMLSEDYKYLDLELQRTDAENGLFHINGIPVGHKVVVEKKNFKQHMSLLGRLVHKFKVLESHYIYDFFNPREISSYSKEELEHGLLHRELALVDIIDEDILDTTNFRLEMEPSCYAFKKGEIYGAPYDCYRVFYSNEKQKLNLLPDRNIEELAEKSPLLIDDLLSTRRTLSKQRKNTLMRYLLEDYLIATERNAESQKIKDAHIEELEAKYNAIIERDGLTQVYNIQGFNKYANLLYATDNRLNQYSSVIFCDIDYFKKFNDYYGHPKGDKCLQYFAKTLQNCLKRDNDVFGRYGGEEFVAFLSGTDREGAEKIVNKMIYELEINAYPHIKTDLGYVSASFGICCTNNSESLTLKELISNADLALYKAKEGGRNRLEFYDPLTCIIKS